MEIEQNPPFSKILLKTAYRCSIIAALFLTISAIGLVLSAYQTRLAYGWIYEQTIMIGGDIVTSTIYVKEQFAFAAILFMISAIQWVNVVLLRRFIINFI